jgi:lysophospholipase L1-like esterase
VRGVPRLRRLLVLAGLVAGCGLAAGCGGAEPPAPEPASSTASHDVAQNKPRLTRLVVLGDSIAQGFGVEPGQEFHSLLMRNDDQRYPEFEGRDLMGRFSGVEKTVLSKPAATSPKTVIQAQSVSSNRSGRTLVIISVGLNDFRTDMLSALDADKVRDKALAVIGNLARIQQHFADTSRFPHGAVIGLFNIYDPTDQAGKLPPWLDLCYFFHCSCYAAFSKSGNLALFNELLAGFARRSGWVLLDLHGRFKGHGYQQHPIQAQDPDLWFQADCLHANERGNHEIRQLVWEATAKRW